MNTPVETKSKKERTWKVIRVILAVLGILSMTVAILAITGLLEDILLRMNFSGTYDNDTQLVIILITSILGVLFLFAAFSPFIDRFFDVMERKELKLSKDEKKEGVSLELIFFLLIGITLLVIAILLGIGKLVVQVELPLLGPSTEGFIIGSLVVLSLVSIIVAFNEFIRNSLKELKKVHWPKGNDMSKYSAQVFTFVIFFGLLFFGLDVVIELGLNGLKSLLG